MPYGVLHARRGTNLGEPPHEAEGSAWLGSKTQRIGTGLPRLLCGVRESLQHLATTDWAMSILQGFRRASDPIGLF
jgi:hypothetical protein